MQFISKQQTGKSETQKLIYRHVQHVRPNRGWGPTKMGPPHED